MYPIKHFIEKKRNFIPRGGIDDSATYKGTAYRGTSHTVYAYEHEHQITFIQVWYTTMAKAPVILKKIIVKYYPEKNCYKVFVRESNGKCVNRPYANISTTKAGHKRVNRLLHSFARRHGFKRRIYVDMQPSTSLMCLVYPMMNNLLWDKEKRIEYCHLHTIGNAGPLLKLESTKVLCKKLFGSSGKTWTKRLMRTVSERYSSVHANPNIVVTLQALKNIPFKHLSPKVATALFERGESYWYIFSDGWNFTRLSLADKIHLLTLYVKTENDTGSSHFLSDTARMLNMYGITEYPKYMPLSDLHDWIVKCVSTKSFEDTQYEVPKALESVDNKTVGDYVIRAPHSRHELMRWGNDMHNCIGSYHSDYLNKKLYLLCALNPDGNKPVYNISIRGGKIEQFYGSYNSHPNPQDLDLITEFLKDKGLINVDAASST